MRYLVISMLLLSGCGRSNYQNHTCSAEQQERLEKYVNECAKGYANSVANCWQMMVKNICTYKE